MLLFTLVEYFVYSSWENTIPGHLNSKGYEVLEHSGSAESVDPPAVFPGNKKLKNSDISNTMSNCTYIELCSGFSGFWNRLDGFRYKEESANEEKAIIWKCDVK
jgi:hypothetical protein